MMSIPFSVKVVDFLFTLTTASLDHRLSTNDEVLTMMSIPFSVKVVDFLFTLTTASLKQWDLPYFFLELSPVPVLDDGPELAGSSADGDVRSQDYSHTGRPASIHRPVSLDGLVLGRGWRLSHLRWNDRERALGLDGWPLHGRVRCQHRWRQSMYVAVQESNLFYFFILWNCYWSINDELLFSSQVSVGKVSNSLFPYELFEQNFKVDGIARHPRLIPCVSHRQNVLLVKRNSLPYSAFFLLDSPHTDGFDLSLIKLDRAIHFNNYVKPVQLPRRKGEDPPGTMNYFYIWSLNLNEVVNCINIWIWLF